jgi:hypothetical protein
MKRFVLVAVLVGLLAVALASTAFAAPQGQGGPGNGIHTPGTGLTAQPGTGYGPGSGTCTGTCTGAGAGKGAGAGMRGGPAWAGQPDEVATLLGMSAEEIQAERLAGKSLVQIAAGKDVTEKQLVDTILGAKKATLDKLVADGQLSQAQADAMYGRMQTQVSVMVNRTTTGPVGNMNGMGMGMGQGRGGRWSR